MASAFAAALDIVLALEGGGATTNDPADPGGLTRWGISQRAHPNVDVANLTREQAGEIYRAHYWTPVCASELPAPIAIALFEGAVNLGVRPAVRLMQRALRLEADGVVGPATLARARGSNSAVIVPLYYRYRVEEYLRQATERPVKQRFLGGWISRCLIAQWRIVALGMEA